MEDPDGGFFDTPVGAQTPLRRPKELQDNAIPSGNALATEVLLELSMFSHNVDYVGKSQRGLNLVSELLAKHPSSFGRWLCIANLALNNTSQVAIIGELHDECTKTFLKTLWAKYRPFMVTAVSPEPVPQDSPALLADRSMIDDLTTAYVCQAFVCQQPVTDAQDLENQL